MADSRLPEKILDLFKVMTEKLEGSRLVTQNIHEDGVRTRGIWKVVNHTTGPEYRAKIKTPQGESLYFFAKDRGVEGVFTTLSPMSEIPDFIIYARGGNIDTKNYQG